VPAPPTQVALKMNGGPGLKGFSVHPMGSAVLRISALSAPGGIFPWAEIASAATPATCGEAIDVPWRKAQPPGTLESTTPAPRGEIWNRASPPGAVTSVTPTP